MEKIKYLKTQKNSFQPAEKNKISYGQTLAYSLILYANRNKNFSETLRILIRRRSKENQRNLTRGFISIPKEVAVILPENEFSAAKKARWLVEMISQKNISDYDEAEQILLTWLDDKIREEPKQLVVGIVLVAIPGITMGKFKRKKEKMAIFLRSDLLYPGLHLDLAKQISKASHDVILKALTKVGGNLKNLEPQTNEWLLEEKKFSFFRAEEIEMLKIKEGLERLGITNSSVSDEKGLAILAVSPEINENYFKSFEEI